MLSLFNKREKVSFSPGDVFIGYDIKQNGRPIKLKLNDRFLHMQIFGPTGCGKTSMILLPMIFSDYNSHPFIFNNAYIHHMGQLVIDPKGDLAEKCWAIGQINDNQRRVKDLNYCRQIMTIFVNHRKKLIYEVKKLEKDPNRDDPKNNFLVKRYHLKTFNKAFEYLKDIVQPTYLKNCSNYAIHLLGTDIANLISFPNDRKIILRDYKNIKERDPFLLFDPTADDCPYFNPLEGENEADIVHNITDTILSFNSDSKSYFRTEGEALLTNAVKVVLRSSKLDSASPTPTLKKLEALLFNYGSSSYPESGKGYEMINMLINNQEGMSDTERKENRDLYQWFKDQYFYVNSMGNTSKVFQATGNYRSNIAKLNADPRLGRVLNPPEGIKSQINFQDILHDGDTVAISTAQGELSELGDYLGKFLISQFQSAVFKRNGSDGLRIPFMLYIDEFQQFANETFQKILTQGRSYCVGATLATQTRGLIENYTNRGFLEVVDANCRNIITFPGISIDDAKHFSNKFGDVKTRETNISRSTSDDQNHNLMDFFGSRSNFNNDRQTISQREDTKPLFSETALTFGINVYPERAKLQIVQRENNLDSSKIKSITKKTMGHLFYQVVVDGNLTQPGYAKVNWLPKNITNQISDEVERYNIKIRNADRLKNKSSNVVIKKQEEAPIVPQIKFKEAIINPDDNVAEINKKVGGIKPDDNSNPESDFDLMEKAPLEININDQNFESPKIGQEKPKKTNDSNNQLSDEHQADFEISFEDSLDNNN